MGASGTLIGLIFGIYPLVVFAVAPVIGVLVSCFYYYQEFLCGTILDVFLALITNNKYILWRPFHNNEQSS